MSQTRDQKRFTISEVAADWHDRANDTAAHSIARVSEQLDPRFAASTLADMPPPTLGLHPVACKLLLISRPAEGRRLS